MRLTWAPRRPKLLLIVSSHSTRSRWARLCRSKMQRPCSVMSTFVGSLALCCGWMLMVVNTALITAKHVNIHFWWYGKTDENRLLNQGKIPYGFFENTAHWQALNYLIILAKYHIFCTNGHKDEICFQSVLLRVKEKVTILKEAMDEIVFSSLIAFNELLTSHCDNLSTHHHHVTYHPCFNTQFHHSQATQQYFCAVAMFQEKAKAIELPAKEIVLTRIGLTRKGDPRKGCETLNNN